MTKKLDSSRDTAPLLYHLYYQKKAYPQKGEQLI